MYNIVIWGTGSYYPRFLSSIINYEMQLKHINVLCFTGNDAGTSKHTLNSIPILPVDIALNLDFDYIIIASEYYEQTILKQLMSPDNSFNVSSDKIILGRVFHLPHFNLNDYCKLRERKTTIISDTCLAGFLYHQLGMPFNTPFVNMRINPYNYIKFLQNPEKYLKMDMKIVQDREFDAQQMNIPMEPTSFLWDRGNYPILSLGDEIFFHCIHAESAKEALDAWNRRVERINYDDLFFMMIIENDEIAELFSEIKGIKKLGFYFKDTDCDDIINTRKYSDLQVRHSFHFVYYMHALINQTDDYNLDLIKLCNNDHSCYLYN